MPPASTCSSTSPRCRRSIWRLDNVALFPHLGSSTVHTRQKMEQLVVDNLLAWGAGKPPITPVPETPWLQEQPGQPKNRQSA